MKEEKENFRLIPKGSITTQWTYKKLIMEYPNTKFRVYPRYSKKTVVNDFVTKQFFLDRLGHLLKPLSFNVAHSTRHFLRLNLTGIGVLRSTSSYWQSLEAARGSKTMRFNAVLI